jgi:transposase-like protein
MWGQFPNDDAATKLLFFVLNRASYNRKRSPRVWLQSRSRPRRSSPGGALEATNASAQRIATSR